MKKQKNENVSYLSEVLDKLKEHKMAMAGLVVLIVEILMVVFLPMILKLDPYIRIQLQDHGKKNHHQDFHDQDYQACHSHFVLFQFIKYLGKIAYIFVFLFFHFCLLSSLIYS